MYDLWCAASKPNHGVIFNLMKNAKYKYKLKSFENRVSDELYDNLIEKDMLSFWKTWNSKLASKPIYATQINGLSSDLSIADICRMSLRYFCAEIVISVCTYLTQRILGFYQKLVRLISLRTKF